MRSSRLQNSSASYRELSMYPNDVRRAAELYMSIVKCLSSVECFTRIAPRTITGQCRAAKYHRFMYKSDIFNSYFHKKVVSMNKKSCIL